MNDCWANAKKNYFTNRTHDAGVFDVEIKNKLKLKFGF